MNTWTPASAASLRWLMNDWNIDLSTAAQRSSFIQKERGPFCNRFIHQRQHPEGGTLLCPQRIERREQGTNQKENKQIDENENSECRSPNSSLNLFQPSGPSTGTRPYLLLRCDLFPPFLVCWVWLIWPCNTYEKAWLWHSFALLCFVSFA